MMWKHFSHYSIFSWTNPKYSWQPRVIPSNIFIPLPLPPSSTNRVVPEGKLSELWWDAADAICLSGPVLNHYKNIAAKCKRVFDCFQKYLRGSSVYPRAPTYPKMSTNGGLVMKLAPKRCINVIFPHHGTVLSRNLITFFKKIQKRHQGAFSGALDSFP